MLFPIKHPIMLLAPRSPNCTGAQNNTEYVYCIYQLATILSKYYKFNTAVYNCLNEF